MICSGSFTMGANRVQTMIIGISSFVLFCGVFCDCDRAFDSDSHDFATSSVPPTAQGNDVDSDKPCSNVLPTRKVWPLSRAEYDNTVNAALGNSSNQAQKLFPAEDRANGFTSNAQAEIVESNLVNLLMTAAETIASQSVAGEMNYLATDLQCTLSASPSPTSQDPCAINYIAARGAAFFRRPLTTDEVSDLYQAYLTGFNNPFPNTNATVSGIENVIVTALQSPQFFYRTELGLNSDTSSDPVQLTPYEVASAISYLATGSPPDATLLAAASSGSLNTAQAVTSQYQRLIATPAGKEKVAEFVLEWLGADQVSQLGNANGPLTPALAAAMFTETKDFVQEVVFNGTGTIHELLTANYTFLNADLAAYYGLPASNLGANFSRVSLGSDTDRGGVLSQGAFLVSASNVEAGVPLLHRGRIIRQQLLCEALPSAASLGLPGFTPPPFTNPPAGTTTRQALTKDIVGTCYNCHQFFMPIGFGLENFDPFARYQTTQNGGTVDSSGELIEPASIDEDSGLILSSESFNQASFSGYLALASALAADRRTLSCFNFQVVSYASGRNNVGQDECSVRFASQSSRDGVSTATIQEQFQNYLQSQSFAWRSR
ncbi:MAG: hypothetical protein C5B49_15905 [Bdellovibrio sp.]|nr:MAG: hypothetical protein C5B49_15905 [Bdellovibrio sp.]